MSARAPHKFLVARKMIEVLTVVTFMIFARSTLKIESLYASETLVFTCKTTSFLQLVQYSTSCAKSSTSLLCFMGSLFISASRGVELSSKREKSLLRWFVPDRPGALFIGLYPQLLHWSSCLSTPDKDLVARWLHLITYSNNEICSVCIA
jgi:hypothetical protein